MRAWLFQGASEKVQIFGLGNGLSAPIIVPADVIADKARSDSD